MKEQDTTATSLDEKEFDEAKKEAMESPSTYVHHFRKPFVYDDKSYNEMEFDFEGLTGQDSLDVENELQRKGITVIVPTFSGEYLIRIAAKACVQPIGADAMLMMPISEYNRIRSAARSFLLKSEL